MITSNKALVGVLIAGLTGITVFLFVSLSGGGTASAKTCRVGERDCLPDVNLVDTMGIAYTPKSLAGKVVVVNFWATWCGPCLKEIPDLSKVYEQHKDHGLIVLGVLSSDQPDNQELLNFQSDHMMSYPVVRDTTEIRSSYGNPKNLPTTFIYDRRGKLMHSPRGALHAAQLAKLLDPLLAQK
jgi:cytochrome c biogenesis protein CcmG/thiol:disulfide interchange protein DsbE